MTKRDFELIAEVMDDLDGSEIGLSRGTHNAIAEALADAFSRTNPRFNRSRFLKACGAMDHV